MNAAAYLSTLAALAGSAIGALASFTTTWLTHHYQTRAQRIATENARREKLFGDFIDEASRLFADALVHSLEDPSKLVPLYAVLSKLRLFATPETIERAHAVLQHVIQIYDSPNRDYRTPQKREGEEFDILRAFTESCRDELRG